MEHLIPVPTSIDFHRANLVDVWKLYLNAIMSSKSEKEKYSMFLLCIGETGREIFSTFTWDKKRDADGNATDEDNITTDGVFEKFEGYCLPKKNLILERMKFFLRNQGPEEPFDIFLTEARNLASTCEFSTINNGMVLFKIADGINQKHLREKILSKGADIILENAIEMCRVNELKKITNMSDKHASTTYTDIQEIQRVNNTGSVNEVPENVGVIFQVIVDIVEEYISQGNVQLINDVADTVISLTTMENAVDQKS